MGRILADTVEQESNMQTFAAIANKANANKAWFIAAL